VGDKIQVIDKAKDEKFEKQLDVYRQLILKFMEKHKFKPDTIILPALYAYKKEYEDVLKRLSKKYKIIFTYTVDKSYVAFAPDLIIHNPDEDEIPF